MCKTAREEEDTVSTDHCLERKRDTHLLVSYALTSRGTYTGTLPSGDIRVIRFV